MSVRVTSMPGPIESKLMQIFRLHFLVDDFSKSFSDVTENEHREIMRKGRVQFCFHTIWPWSRLLGDTAVSDHDPE